MFNYSEVYISCGVLFIVFTGMRIVVFPCITFFIGYLESHSNQDLIRVMSIIDDSCSIFTSKILSLFFRLRFIKNKVLLKAMTKSHMLSGRERLQYQKEFYQKSKCIFYKG
ncbi:hypothetical protein GFK82_00255 [Candidatus Steffania adelgidicola]|nr:hypothetical protein GFK82_00255 [Candidatus Steffania adelgidicola]